MVGIIEQSSSPVQTAIMLGSSKEIWSFFWRLKEVVLFPNPDNNWDGT